VERQFVAPATVSTCYVHNFFLSASSNTDDDDDFCDDDDECFSMNKVD